ncbi:hypothetical protein F5880DRAFT_1505812 [Lentinula raphanica]|nr:hypothetical protein F5880DRAFT_1505812 [Lentinula raphanica]
MTRSTPSRALALVLFGAAISSGVLAAPTPSPMNSDHYRSSNVVKPNMSISDLNLEEKDRMRTTSPVTLIKLDAQHHWQVPQAMITPGPRKLIVNSSRSASTQHFDRRLHFLIIAVFSLSTSQAELRAHAERDRSILEELGDSEERQAPADSQFFHQHRSQLDPILKNAEEIAATTVPLDVLDIVLKNHHQCLQFVPDSEPEKVDAEKRLSDSLRRRRTMLDSMRHIQLRQGQY